MKFKKTESIYEQIALSIQENILEKKWVAGDRLPSVRETAGRIQVNPNTVMRTYSLLQENGIIYNKRGIGFFVSDDALEKTIEMKKQKFNTDFLPTFFKLMDQLDMNWSDVETAYEKWKEEQIKQLAK